MPAQIVEAAEQTRGDDVHDSFHDVHDAAPTFSSADHSARMAGMLRRSTTSTSDIVHDKYFIPGVVASGVILGIALVCVILLLRKKTKPPGVQWATPQTRLAPDMQQQASLSAQGHMNNVAPGPPGSPEGSRRLSHIQRKPLADLPRGAESIAPPPEGPPYDVNGAYGAPVAYSNSQNHPGTIYSPQSQTVAFESLPHGQGHQAQYQGQYPQYDSQQHSYHPQSSAVNMTVTPANAPSTGQWQQNQQYPPNYPGAAPTRVSILSTDQSVTQIGSDKDYYPGGYGKMGVQPQKPGDGSDGSPRHEEEEYFDPYGGIERGNTAGSRNQVRR